MFKTKKTLSLFSIVSWKFCTFFLLKFFCFFIFFLCYIVSICTFFSTLDVKTLLRNEIFFVIKANWFRFNLIKFGKSGESTAKGENKFFEEERLIQNRNTCRCHSRSRARIPRKQLWIVQYDNNAFNE